MKKLLTISLLLFTFMGASAQDYLWPVQGKAAGTDIASSPQSYIQNEFNYTYLFIGGNAGDTIVAPADATIYNFGFVQSESLVISNYGGFGSNRTFNELLKMARAQKKELDPRSYSITMNLSMPDGTELNISGLEGDFSFKTGQKVKRGEPIGVMGYGYTKIGQPNIQVARTKAKVPIDPMAPFGIETTYIAPVIEDPILRVSKDQAKEDYTIFFEALQELYPGLSSLIPDEEQAAFLNAQLAAIDAKVTEDDSISVLYLAGRLDADTKIHDNHLAIMRPKRVFRPSLYHLPRVMLGFINDTLRVTTATSEFQYLIGQQVLANNDIDADSAKAIMYNVSCDYDADVQSLKQFDAATLTYGLLFPAGSNYDATLLLADSTTVFAKGKSTASGFPEYVKDVFPFTNQHIKQSRISHKQLNDSTAYLKIGTFNLSQVEIDSVAAYLQSIDSVPNLIVDVRNNSGGETSVLKRIYSYLAGAPMTLNGYQRVNAQGPFHSMKYSLDRTAQDTLFAEYQPIEGKPGYFYRDSLDNRIVPDTVVNYPGRIYMLTNEHSCSAATLLPAMLVRNHRGVTVGRETASGYHRMHAYKTTCLTLPNSKIVVAIPLVEVCFDTQVNERVPSGRGVMPDYEVSISLPELWSECGDTILNRTLELIANNEYINYENPFVEAVPDEEGEISRGDVSFNIWIVVLFLLPIIVYFVSKRKKK